MACRPCGATSNCVTEADPKVTNQQAKGEPMLSALRRHLTYANVMATLAVFIALGGSSYAAFTISGRNIKNPPIPGKKPPPNRLPGCEIRGVGLGKVGQAANADR